MIHLGGKKQKLTRGVVGVDEDQAEDPDEEEVGRGVADEPVERVLQVPTEYLEHGGLRIRLRIRPGSPDRIDLFLRYRNAEHVLRGIGVIEARVPGSGPQFDSCSDKMLFSDLSANHS